MNNDRSPGYYRVKYYGEWQIRYYNGEQWQDNEYSCRPIVDSYFDEIKESGVIADPQTQSDVEAEIGDMLAQCQTENERLKEPLRQSLNRFFIWFRDNGESHVNKSIEKMIEYYLDRGLTPEWDLK